MRRRPLPLEQSLRSAKKDRVSYLTSLTTIQLLVPRLLCLLLPHQRRMVPHSLDMEHQLPHNLDMEHQLPQPMELPLLILLNQPMELPLSLLLALLLLHNQPMVLQLIRGAPHHPRRPHTVVVLLQISGELQSLQPQLLSISARLLLSQRPLLSGLHLRSHRPTDLPPLLTSHKRLLPNQITEDRTLQPLNPIMVLRRTLLLPRHLLLNQITVPRRTLLLLPSQTTVLQLLPNQTMVRLLRTTILSLISVLLLLPILVLQHRPQKLLPRLTLRCLQCLV